MMPLNKNLIVTVVSGSVGSYNLRQGDRPVALPDTATIIELCRPIGLSPKQMFGTKTRTHLSPSIISLYYNVIIFSAMQKSHY